MQLSRIILRVKSPERLAHFYVEHLGMTVRQKGEVFVLGYTRDDASIELRRATSPHTYVNQKIDYYWKIGITLPNVDLAYKKLSAKSLVNATQQSQSLIQPSQFEDIGYLCHLRDPEGFSIELLQHKFDGNRSAAEGDPDRPFSEARVGQITLRVGKEGLEESLNFYRAKLGMSLLSIQPVSKYGFTLYFLGFTTELPPHESLEAVENREWLWQRPYTTLELQHFHAGRHSFQVPGDGEAGYGGLRISGVLDEGDSLLDSAGGVVELDNGSNERLSGS